MDYYYGIAQANPYAQAAQTDEAIAHPELKTLIRTVRHKVKTAHDAL